MLADYDEDEIERTEFEVSNELHEETTKLPKHIVDRTENILSTRPMTNQNLILHLAVWWFENAGNCPIYKWTIHHLDYLENDSLHVRDVDILREALNQAEDIGLDVQE